MSAESHENLVQLLTANQTRLYGFILTLLPDRERAKDVLQDTNLVIWRKAEEFQPGTNFWAWACKIARYRVLAYYRDAGRDLHVFDDSVLDGVAAAAEEFSADSERSSALLGCLKKLPSKQLALIEDRYTRGQSILAIAERKQQTAAAVKMALLRVRRVLLECVEAALEGSRQP